MKKAVISLVLLAIISLTLFAEDIIEVFSLPIAESNNFSGSGNCTLCHQGGVGVFEDEMGNDISPNNLWVTSMMANASKDPYWRAKVSAEVDNFPEIQAVIEDKCNSCHTPMGQREAILSGATHFTFAEAMADPLSLDGVSCTVCHQITDVNFGLEESFTARFVINENKEIYGPHENPRFNPMTNMSGYSPVFSNHIKQSELCATCHTLYTPYLDNDNNIAGEFPEQTPFLEWKNSIYVEQEMSCQSCHMEVHNVNTKLSTLGPIGDRTPIHAHTFYGANIFMNNLIFDNANNIGINFDQAQKDLYQTKSMSFLESAVDLDFEAKSTDGKIEVNVSLTNNAGHKYPTGFPSRESWINLVVTGDNGNVIFESGKLMEDGSILGEDEEFEPHHDVIDSDDKVQIYQAVMADVDNKATSILLRGAKYIKDNRLVPQGYENNEFLTKDIEIVGIGDDTNFNLDGNGSDIVTYIIPVDESLTSYTVTAKLYYRTISKKFQESLFEHQTEEVLAFKEMFDNQESSAVIVKEIEKEFIFSSVNDDSGSLIVFPNPFQFGFKIQIPNSWLYNKLEIFTLNGEIIYKSNIAGKSEINVSAKELLRNLTSGQAVFIKLSGGTFAKTEKLVYMK